MSRSSTLMEGSTEFYPFCYLLLAADTALDAAKLALPGRNYHYATCAVFSAFAFEAALNHVGIDHVKDWAKNERSMGNWKDKLKLLAEKFGMDLDFGKAPLQTVKASIGVRDKLAHGKTWIGEHCFVDEGNGIGDADIPDWLLSSLNESRATQFIADAREMISQLLAKAGYPAINLHLIGQDSFDEVIDPEAKPRPSVWKIKGA
jgi:hypothetical protein